MPLTPPASLNFFAFLLYNIYFWKNSKYYIKIGNTTKKIFSEILYTHIRKVADAAQTGTLPAAACFHRRARALPHSFDWGIV
jgi:hypothetical protein